MKSGPAFCGENIYFTVEPRYKGIYFLFFFVFFFVCLFSSKFQIRTPWRNDQNLIVPVVKKEKKDDVILQYSLIDRCYGVFD